MSATATAEVEEKAAAAVEVVVKVVVVEVVVVVVAVVAVAVVVVVALVLAAVLCWWCYINAGAAQCLVLCVRATGRLCAGAKHGQCLYNISLDYCRCQWLRVVCERACMKEPEERRRRCRL